MKANNVKTKLKTLLKSVDSDKSGLVKWEVFFPMLDLHKVKLSEKDISSLKKAHSKNQTINYKDAVNQLTIDLQAAAGSDPEATDGQLKWTIFSNHALNEKSIQQLGGNHLIKKDSDAASKAGSYLSRDKLQDMEKKYEELKAASQAGSRPAMSKAGSAFSKASKSIAASKVLSKATTLKSI